MVPICTAALKVEGASKDGVCQHTIPGEPQQIPAPLADALILARELLVFCSVSWGKWVYAKLVRSGILVPYSPVFLLSMSVVLKPNVLGTHLSSVGTKG